MEKKGNPFAGRSIAVVKDLSVDEQRYLYQQTARFKKAWLAGEDLEPFRIRDPELGVHLLFLENSTRTKESFRSAAGFHDVQLRDFDAAASSVSKAESLVDTVKTLFGYNRRSLFILRTRLEGVCRLLEEELGDFARRVNREKPIFINGGDGRHEHPTQEFLDEFTFLEQKNWDDSHLHIALIGDLYHGRTIYSKISGLRIFREVKVDLIAPEELAFPAASQEEMRKNGFEVVSWPSLESYLASSQQADIWYFTRLQLERMGDEVRERVPELYRSVSFQREYLEKLPPGVRFYHPLPRHQKHPVIPPFLDRTQLNGWDTQSMNGYFTRVVELALTAGKLGFDFEGSSPSPPPSGEDFVQSTPLRGKSRVEDRHKVGIKPVDQGVVIDHIAKGLPLDEIWDRINKIRQILGFNVRSSHGVYHSQDQEIFKGIISLPDVDIMERKDLKKLAAISPGCTLNIIKNRTIVEKYRLQMPPRIYNFDEITCRNEACVTHSPGQPNLFQRSGEDSFVCRYCGHHHNFKEIWEI